MKADDIFNMLIGIQFWDVVKLLLVVSLIIYVIFSLIVIRQVELMGGVVKLSLTPILRFIAVVHFFISIGIFLLALLIL
jgi:hypothetical protein